MAKPKKKPTAKSKKPAKPAKSPSKARKPTAKKKPARPAAKPKKAKPARAATPKRAAKPKPRGAAAARPKGKSGAAKARKPARKKKATPETKKPTLVVASVVEELEPIGAPAGTGDSGEEAEDESGGDTVTAIPESSEADLEDDDWGISTDETELDRDEDDREE